MAERLPTREDVERAARVIAGRLHRTPLLRCSSLGRGRYLKAELLQKTGSFKPRGVLTTLASLSDAERARGVISVSAGNHAQAVAWAAREEGLDALLVMWEGASKAKIEATRAYGGRVDLAARGPDDAFPHMEAIRRETGRVLIHPFDDLRTIAGQGTVGLEILDDLPTVDTIVVGCGGGGLVSGIATACVPAGVRVVAVEPEGSRALSLALQAGHPVHVSPSSIADALNAPFAGALATRICADHRVEVVTVSEEEIEDAFRFLYARAKLACEPGAAAATAAILTGRVSGRTVVSVVSGGNVALETSAAILAGR